MKERYIWIDWMKVIGMLFIVWGHFFPTYSSNWIYAFNVPLFFCISGCLTNVKMGGAKLFNSLIIPYFIMSIILIPYNYLVSILSGHPNWSDIGRTTLAFILGEQRAVVESTPDIVYRPGCGTLWFVYVLALIKLLFNPTHKKLLVLSLPLSLVLAYISPIIKPIGDYAVFTLPLAWFFFTVGYLVMHSEIFHGFHNKAKEYIKTSKLHLTFVLISVLILTVLLYEIGEANGMVKFYRSEYGNNLALMIVGSFIGTCIIYLIALIMETLELKGRLLAMTSNGTLLILAFHTQVIYILYRTFLAGRSDVITFLLSVLIMAAFLPVIWAVFKYFPIMVGKRK